MNRKQLVKAYYERESNGRSDTCIIAVRKYMNRDSTFQRSGFRLWIATFTVAIIIIIVFGEILIRIIAPQQSMYPRRERSSEYGFVNWKDGRVTHKKPGEWEFVYTTNGHRNRGPLISISNSYRKKNLVVLGDSNSFGVGVNDGEEYAAIMRKELRETYNVINLSVGGWGLTQQIRRYYEFGKLYSPNIVILQFAGNDFKDNFKYKVTEIEDDRFRFVESDNPLVWLNEYLSQSIIQKSQIYNLIRDSLFTIIIGRHQDRAFKKHQSSKSLEVPIKVEFYMELLKLFANDLNRTGTDLIFISANPNEFFSRNPYFKNQVSALEEHNLLHFIDVFDWLEGVSDYHSPQGHIWGAKAHAIIGEGLADAVHQSIRTETF